MSALNTTILSGDTKKILDALNSGADVDSPLGICHPTPDNFYTPLHAAASSSMCGIKITELLIMRGASVTRAEVRGFTPLHISTTLEKSRLLLQHKANVNCKDLLGKTPLHYAVFKGDTNRVKVMLEYKADPTLPDNNGETALEMAIRYFSTYGITALLEAHIKNTESVKKESSPSPKS